MSEPRKGSLPSILDVAVPSLDPITEESIRYAGKVIEEICAPDDRDIMDIWRDVPQYYNYLTGIVRDPNNPLDVMLQAVIGPDMKVCFGKWTGRKVKASNYPFYDLIDEYKTDDPLLGY